MELSAVEVRVLGCLVEKALATPQSYPLSLNALVAACNQSTNRDPVVDYDDRSVRDALTELRRQELTRTVYARGGRVPKFAHRLDETLELAAPGQAVLAQLALRGPQTPAELRARGERLHRFADADEVEAVLARLLAERDDPSGPERPLIRRLARRPGQKEARVAHLLGGEPAGDEPAARGGFLHVVAFRFDDAAAAAEALERLRALVGVVDAIRELDAGIDDRDAPDGWTLGLVVRLATPAALPAYRDHPAHAELAAWIRARAQVLAVADFSLG